MYERYINRLLLTHPHPGTWPATQAYTLTRNQTDDPLVRRPAFNPLSHTSRGWFHLLQKADLISPSSDFFTLCTCTSSLFSLIDIAHVLCLLKNILQTLESKDHFFFKQNLIFCIMACDSRYSDSLCIWQGAFSHKYYRKL